jgi:soluble lytic murein transglycosylase-like protein
MSKTTLFNGRSLTIAAFVTASMAAAYGAALHLSPTDDTPAPTHKATVAYASLPSGKVNVPAKFRAHVEQAAARFNVPVDLLAAVLRRESSWNPQALSKVGAKGLGQFMPKTARAFGVDPDHAASSIHGAARYLAYLRDRFGNWQHAVAAYNAGPTRLAAWLDGKGKPLAEETVQYVQVIMGEPIRRVQMASN